MRRLDPQTGSRVSLRTELTTAALTGAPVLFAVCNCPVLFSLLTPSSQLEHAQDLLHHPICPALDVLDRPLILVYDVLIQVEAVAVADRIAVAVAAVLLLLEGLVAEGAVVAGDGQIAKLVRILLQVLPCLGTIAIGDHVHPAVRDVLTLREDVLNGPDVLLAVVLDPQVLLALCRYALLGGHAEDEPGHAGVVLVDGAAEFLL